MGGTVFALYSTFVRSLFSPSLEFVHFNTILLAGCRSVRVHVGESVPAPDFSPGERAFKPAETLSQNVRALALVAAYQPVR